MLIRKYCVLCLRKRSVARHEAWDHSMCADRGFLPRNSGFQNDSSKKPLIFDPKSHINPSHQSEMGVDILYLQLSRWEATCCTFLFHNTLYADVDIVPARKTAKKIRTGCPQTTFRIRKNSQKYNSDQLQQPVGDGFDEGDAAALEAMVAREIDLPVVCGGTELLELGP